MSDSHSAENADEAKLKGLESQLQEKNLEIKSLKIQRLGLAVPCFTAIVTSVALLYQAKQQSNASITVANMQGKDSQNLEEKKAISAIIVEILKSSDQTETARRLKFLYQIKYLQLDKEQVEELNRMLPAKDSSSSIVVPGAPTIKVLFDKMESFLREFKDVDVRDDEHSDMPRGEIDRLRQAKQRLVEIEVLAAYLKRSDIYQKFYYGLSSGVHMLPLPGLKGPIK
jgi:hypothetical protein